MKKNKFLLDLEVITKFIFHDGSLSRMTDAYFSAAPVNI